MAASLLLIALQVFTVTQTALSQGTIPTHYGDPKTGCESDEQSVKVQGLSGDFCSAACKGSVCPTDKPSGATAKPTCALKSTTGSQYCALICSPSALSLNGANGECGTGTCQSVQGTGICTYARSTELALPPVLIVAEMIQANPTHYGDPKTGCMRDEGRHWGGGLSGWFCSPVCKDDPCPTDKPSGVTAKIGCTDKDDDDYGICTLICSPSALSLNGANGECGTGTCESFAGSSTGECRYTMDVALPPVLIGAEMIQAKSSHYGDKIKSHPTCGLACHTDMKCSMLAAADGSGCDKCAIKGVYTGFCCGSAGKPCDKEEASTDNTSLII